MEADMRAQQEMDTRAPRDERRRRLAQIKLEAAAAADAAADRMIRENIELYGP